VEDLFQQKEKLQEIPRIQRFAARPSLQELFSESSSDPEVVMKAYSYYHYTLKEIRNYLGMHYATVSRLVKRYKTSASRRGEDIAKNKN
jgi:DNA-binding MarR family transcriptional regulator